MRPASWRGREFTEAASGLKPKQQPQKERDQSQQADCEDNYKKMAHPRQRFRNPIVQMDRSLLRWL
jgi:hypothetical protein